MKKHFLSGIRRAAAGLTCMLLLVAQLVLPMAAFATADLSTMPTVLLTYTTDGETPQTLSVTATMNGQQPVYWATLPAAAFSFPGFPITMAIVPAQDSPPYTYTPQLDTPITTGDAMDYNGASTLITVYESGFEVGSYSLYVSSQPIPPAVSSVWVNIRYEDNKGETFYSDQKECYFDGDNIVEVDVSKVPTGYTLTSNQSVFVSVDSMGVATPSEVVFYFNAPQEQKQNGYVMIYYTDIFGNPLGDERRELEPGTHNVIPNAAYVPDGYTLSPEWPSSMEVKVMDDGTTTPDEIIFEYKETEKPIETETDPPVETDPPTDPQTDPPQETETNPPEETDPPSEVTPIGRYGITNGTVNFREAPSKDSKKVVSDASKGTYVWVVGSLTANNNSWYQIIHKGSDCYVMSEYVDLLSQEDSDAYNYAQPTPVPGTETQPPSAAQVPVSYVDAANPANVLLAETVSCAVGQETEIVANLSKVPGYVIVGDDRVTVSVSNDGKATPSTVVFTVQQEAKSGKFTIRYVDTAQKEISEPQTVEMAAGTYNVTPDPAKVPQGYFLAAGTPATAQVMINNQGIATPDTVVFTYEKAVVAANVTVEYKDTLGASIADSESRTLQEGDNTVTPQANIPQGYTLTSAASVNVKVDASGNATPNPVTFLYESAAKKATVTVNYKDAAGRDVVVPQKLELEKGTHTVTPNNAIVPSAYTLTSADSFQVAVDDRGVASPDSVTFLYETPPVSAKVTISYVDSSNNNSIISSKEEVLEQGSHTIVPELPADYVLAAGSPIQAKITVSSAGVATPASVTFILQKEEPDMYVGYAVTTGQTALRTDAKMGDQYIKETLPKDTLLYIINQVEKDNILWDGAQTVLGTNLTSGLVQDSQVRHITNDEADKIRKDYEDAHATPTPSPTPKPTPIPNQVTGYFITIGDNVPLRVVNDTYAQAQAWLPIDTVVYVSGQLYENNQGWHISAYNGLTGYIRKDQLRQMSAKEVETYLASQKPTPTPAATPAPYDPTANSSYGYITSSQVNFRLTPNGTVIKKLNKYAFVLIYSSKEVNGTTWYSINQGGTIGWVSGNYMKTLNLTELNSFLNSNEYLQGLQNNSSSTSSGSTSSGSTSSGTSSSSGSATAGSISSVEDWNVGAWQNTGVSGTGVNASYAPFDPYATPVVSISPDASATVEPEATFVIGTMIPIDYEDESRETQSDSSPWGLIGAGVVLVGGAGGVYAYALNQNKKRKLAAKAAAAGRRTGQAGAGAAGAAGAAAGTKQQQNGQNSPYARRAVAAPPVGGTQQKQPPTGTGASSPYNRPGGVGATGPAGSTNPFAAPVGTGAAGSAGVTGTGAPGSTGSSQGVFGAPLGATNVSGQNPYARPAGETPAPKATESGAGTASASTNPYVQPIGSSADAAKDTPASGRRASRTQRYQSTEGEGGGE